MYSYLKGVNLFIIFQKSNYIIVKFISQIKNKLKIS